MKLAGTVKRFTGVVANAPLLFVNLLFLIALLVSPFQAYGNLSDLTGWLALANRVYDIGLALSLSLTLLPIGHLICRRLRLRFVGSSEELIASFFIGTGIVGTAVLVLGLMGLLRPWSIVGLFIILLGISTTDQRVINNLIRNCFRAATSSRETRVLSLLFLSLISFFVIRALTPPHAADELIYHLPATEQYVAAGRVFPNFDNSLANVPFLLHMIYAICLMAGSDIAAKLFSLFVAVSTSVALYAFCARFLTRRIGVLSMFAFFGAGMVVEVAVTTRIDVSLAGMLFMCTYAMMVFLETRQYAWLWVSAMFAGFSLSIKHSAALWIFIVGLMYVLDQVLKKAGTFRKIVKSGLLYTVIALAVASPWYGKNLVWFNNPLYPFLTGEVAEFGPNGLRYFDANDEQKLDRHFALIEKEETELVRSLEEEIKNQIASRPSRHPMRIWEFFTQPNTYLMAEPNHYPNYLFLIIPLLIFAPRSRVITWLIVVSILFMLATTSQAWIARYLLPAYPSLTIVAVYTISTFGARLVKKTSFADSAPIYAVALTLSVAVGAAAVSLNRFNGLGFVSGNISRRQFVAPLSYYRPIDYINRSLPSNARVMCLGTQLNYGIQRSFVSDESWFATKWRRELIRNESMEDVSQSLKAQGFTHIFYSSGIFEFAATEGLEGTGGLDLMLNTTKRPSRKLPGAFEYQILRNWVTFSDYRSRFLEVLYKDANGYEVLRIK